MAWAVRPEELSALRSFHKALADVNRLRIVQHLATEPATVTELIDTCGLSQPLVSHHLRRLREAGLVVVERHGRESICRLRPETFTELIAREREILGYDKAPPTTAPATEAAAVPQAPGLPLPETAG
jgi:ArsR family transcriptional regulator, zinc-responsive transcriptional repressor